MRRKKEIRFCLQCHKELSGRSVKFCDSSCQQRFLLLQYCDLVKKLGFFPREDSYPAGTRAKRVLMELNGNYCSICKEKEWMGKPIPLVFDHIDGNASNWNLDNCRLICPNCDHQLPTFAGRNSGKGRKYRKKYYTAPVR